MLSMLSTIISSYLLLYTVDLLTITLGTIVFL